MVITLPYLSSAVNWVKKYADYRDWLNGVSCQPSQCSATIQVPSAPYLIRGAPHHLLVRYPGCRDKYYPRPSIFFSMGAKMLQVLLFSIYVIVMGAVILAVVAIDEPISGVVILIIGAPVTVIYAVLASMVENNSRPVGKHDPVKNELDLLGLERPQTTTQIKFGNVALLEISPDHKKTLRKVRNIFIIVYFVIFPVISISINEGWI